ncbi:hypothetical protein ACJJTC_002279 [Scirpophaga incertulas]
MIMNHRTRIDWNYVWIGLYHATQDPNKVELCTCKENKSGDKVRDNGDIIDRLSGGKSSIKFVLKDELKCVPCLGWIMQLNFFLYVKRNWQEDQLNLSQFIDYYNRLGCPYRVVLFPEGTDLSVDNKRRSDKYATGNNLALYKYVLHPRTTGWAVLCSRLRASGLMSVYDVTVAYDAPAQTEGDLLRGHRPKHVHFFVKRYAIEKIPHDESTLRIWLNNRWCEKETILQRFHEDGYFIDASTGKVPIEREPRSLMAASLGFAFWTIIDFIFTYLLLNSVVFQFWVVYHTLLFVFVTKYFGGFQNIQYKLLGTLKL